MDYTADGLNQYAAVGGAALGYDKRGNLTSAASVTYAYNSQNQFSVAGSP